MIKKKMIRVKPLPVIDYGVESYVYLYHDKALKNFLKGDFWREENQRVFQNKLEKLLILQDLKLPTHPEIYDFYIAKFWKTKLFYAYTMERLLHDNIPFAIYNSFENQITILNKIWQNIIFETSYNIYNVDIKPDNYYMDKKGNVKTIDIDNLQVDMYRYDIIPVVLKDLIKKSKHEPTIIELQNLAMLMCVIEVLLGTNTNYYTCDSLREIIDKLFTDIGLKKAMYNVTMAQEEDMGQIIKSLKPSSIHKNNG